MTAVPSAFAGPRLAVAALPVVVADDRKALAADAGASALLEEYDDVALAIGAVDSALAATEAAITAARDGADSAITALGHLPTRAETAAACADVDRLTLAYLALVRDRDGLDRRAIDLAARMMRQR